MRQHTFSEVTFERPRKATRWEKFLGKMDGVAPWQALCALIAPVYPKSGEERP